MFLNPELIIQYLNSLLELDPEAIYNLVEFRTSTNEKLANHESVQVLASASNDKILHSVGLLGILNGLCGVDESGSGYIVAEMDMTDKKILKFLNKKDINK